MHKNYSLATEIIREQQKKTAFWFVAFLFASVAAVIGHMRKRGYEAVYE